MTLVHFLDAGRPACGFSRLSPGRWPPGHVWLGLSQTKPNLPPEHAYCTKCLRIWRGGKLPAYP